MVDSLIIKREPSATPPLLPLLPLPRPANYNVPSLPFVNPSDLDFSTVWPSSEVSPKTKLTPLPNISSCAHSSDASGSGSQSSALLGSLTTPIDLSCELDFKSIQFPLLDGCSSVTQPTAKPPKEPHIPRPPNAFMIFRSFLVKRGCVPASAECRQQNLSRMAGEVWRMLSQPEKDKWQEKANQKLLEHQRLYPNYKFQPSARKSKKKAAANEAESTEYIREIREKYTGFVGPAPPRKKKAKAAHTPSGRVDKQLDCPPPLGPSTGRSVTNAARRASLGRRPSAAQMMYARRPSTSLGFNPSFEFGMNADATIVRPSSVGLPEMDASSLLFGIDFTNISFNNFEQTMSGTPIVQPPYTPCFDSIPPPLVEPLYTHQPVVAQPHGQAACYATYPSAIPPPPQLGDLNQTFYISDDPMPAMNIPMYNIPQVPLASSLDFINSLNAYDFAATSSTEWEMWNELFPTAGIIQ